MSANRQDDASDLEQFERDSAIKAARCLSIDPKPWHTHCAWCGDATEAGVEFCSYGPNSCAADAKWKRGILTKQGLI